MIVDRYSMSFDLRTTNNQQRMSKEKFIKLTSTAVPLSVENIDTDQIIPARFLKATTREGFGENLFRDWRFDSNNRPVKDFVLNDTKFSGKILVGGKNFGCGSSREHAAWAILNNRLLPVVVSDQFLKNIFKWVDENSKTEITIDLRNQIITIGGEQEKFEINAYKKECLMNAYDDIDYLLNLRKEIKEFDEALIVN